MGVKLCDNKLNKQTQPTIMCGLNDQNTCEVLFHTCSQNERIQSPNGKLFSQRMVVDSILRDLTVDCDTDSNNVFRSDSVSPSYRDITENGSCGLNGSSTNEITEHGICDFNGESTNRQIIQSFPDVPETSSSDDNAITNHCTIHSTPLDNTDAACSRVEESKHVHFASDKVNNDSEPQIYVVCGETCALSDDVAICKNSSCQMTLKLTNTDLSHTVYELFPSNSFCDSNETGHDHNNGEYEGQSSTDETRTMTMFTEPETTSNQQTSLSVYDKGLNSDIEAIADEQLEPLAAPDPYVVSNTGADKSTHYKQKAADRGTLYCACGGIAAVAVIVILLINFS